MFGELLATGKHKGEAMAREYAGIITREAERLSHLIDNVLDFARLERGKASYHFAEGHLEEVVERALDVFRHRLEKEKLRLRTEIETEPARRAHGRGRDDAGAAEPGRQRGQVRGRRRRGVGAGCGACRAAVALSIADRGSGHRRTTSSGASSSASTAPRTRARATCAAAASGWRWSSTSPRRTAGASRWRATPGRGSTFTVYVPVAPIDDAGAAKSGWRS